ncbi:hypothetical protein LCGC14_2400950 [marine sediment metagenome]|uniref:Transposase IS3/IS911 family protein n=1 Tax=marine sediment metagenome TaxID=412755 RepID=A0A0F9CHH1_9ZZZZ
MAEVVRRRWTAGRKKDAVIRLLRGESIDEVSRDLGVETYRLENWRERAFEGIELGLKDRQGDPLNEDLDKAKKQIGELSMEVELLRSKIRRKLPLVQRRSKR